MTKSLGKSGINLHSNIACSVLGVSNQQDLSDDLECDDLCYRFGAFLAPVSVGMVTGKLYAKNSVTSRKLHNAWKNINIKMTPPSLGKFDVEDGIKLVAIVAISDNTKDFLIKQKILPNNI